MSYLQYLRRRDAVALQHARKVLRRNRYLQCTGQTQDWAEVIFQNTADYNALASFTSEASLLQGINKQCTFPAQYFNRPNLQPGRLTHIEADGILASTGTPTYLFTLRLNTTQSPTNLGGTQIGATAAITTSSGVSNKWWKLVADIVTTIPGQGTGNATLNCIGYVMSPSGFASPFIYPIEATTPDTATWTVTMDGNLQTYLMLSCTCSANSSSNTITVKRLSVLAQN